jgi:hypothetical protein
LKRYKTSRQQSQWKFRVAPTLTPTLQGYDTLRKRRWTALHGGSFWWGFQSRSYLLFESSGAWGVQLLFHRHRHPAKHGTAQSRHIADHFSSSFESLDAARLCPTYSSAFGGGAGLDRITPRVQQARGRRAVGGHHQMAQRERRCSASEVEDEYRQKIRHNTAR